MNNFRALSGQLKGSELKTVRKKVRNLSELGHLEDLGLAACLVVATH